MTTALVQRSDRRVLALIIAAFCAVALTMWASPARAHSQLESSTPADGATVTSMTEFSLTFGEAITPEFSSYTLTDSTKNVVMLGEPKYDVTKQTVTIPLAQVLAGGKYVIGYSVLSVDGHKVAGSVNFTANPVARDGSSTMASPMASHMSGMTHGDHDDAESTGSSSNWSIWYAIIGAVVGAAVVAIISWVMRRNAKKKADEHEPSNKM